MDDEIANLTTSTVTRTTTAAPTVLEMESINISGLMRGTAGNEDDKSHVKALRYSLYNAATLIIAGAICGALVSGRGVIVGDVWGVKQ